MIHWDHKKLVVLDRDGVINQDSDAYIKSPAEWHPIEGSLAAIARLNRAGFRVAVATNQSGIGRGFYDLTTLGAMHEKMKTLLTAEGGHIDAIEYCPHLPTDGCDCRKPATGMLKAIAKKCRVTPEEILYIGDSKSDWRAAQNFGCEFILVLTGKGEQTLEQIETRALPPIFGNLQEIADSAESYLASQA